MVVEMREASLGWDYLPPSSSPRGRVVGQEPPSVSHSSRESDETTRIQDFLVSVYHMSSILQRRRRRLCSM